MVLATASGKRHKVDMKRPKKISKVKHGLLDASVQQGLEEKLLQLGRIANTAHFVAQKV